MSSQALSEQTPKTQNVEILNNLPGLVEVPTWTVKVHKRINDANISVDHTYQGELEFTVDVSQMGMGRCKHA